MATLENDNARSESDRLIDRITRVVQKERIKALNDFTQVLEEKQQECGWSDATYFEIWNAAKKVNDVSSKVIVSSAALDRKIGKSVVDRVVAYMNQDGDDEDGVEDENVEEIARPFVIELTRESDVVTLAESIVEAVHYKRVQRTDVSKIIAKKPKISKASRQNSR